MALPKRQQHSVEIRSGFPAENFKIAVQSAAKTKQAEDE
jgi:hypothetical protein